MKKAMTYRWLSLLSGLLMVLNSQLTAQALIKVQGGATITIQNGAIWYAKGLMSVDSNALINNSGEMEVDELDNQGIYFGTGMLKSNPFVNKGTVAPGNSQGTLTFSNNFNTNGTLEIEIRSESDFDKIVVLGSAEAKVSGVLKVTFVNYTPPENQAFQIIIAGSYSGDFSQIKATPSSIPLTYLNGVLKVQSVLPVELVKLSAKKQGEDVLLNWRTASELNNRGFELLRSRDARRWQSIHFEPGQGTTSQPHDYVFLDETPFGGLNYYRLRQVDFSGKSTLSQIVSVLMGEENALQVFPNPVGTGELNLFWLGEVDETLQIGLYNAAGQLVRKATMESGSQVLPVGDLPAGLYTLRGSNERRQFVERVMVKN
jgi:hypothetical protein